MSRHISADVWKKLETSRPSGENLTARLADPDLTDRLLCAIDSASNRHLLVPLRTGDQSLRDLQSRGVSVDARVLHVQGRPTAEYLDLECREPTGFGAFDLVAGELAESLGQDGIPPADIVRQVLAKWRRFWSQLPRQVLSRDEQLGLFGELWFLGSWLIPKVGRLEAVRRWRGPHGSRHDFEWPGRSVEVKTTTSVSGRIHHVNGIDQLLPPESGDLLFFSLRLREEGGAEKSLPTVVAACQKQLPPEDDARSMFDSLLARVGYNPAYEDDYAKMRFRVVEEGLFRVDGRFPRLTPLQFRTGVPQGVERIEYEINLSGFGDLCIATNPSELETL